MKVRQQLLAVCEERLQADMEGLGASSSFVICFQGTIVDRIDYNIEQVATSINAGVKELEKVTSGHTTLGRLLQFYCMHFCHLIAFTYLLPAHSGVSAQLS